MRPQRRRVGVTAAFGAVLAAATLLAGCADPQPVQEPLPQVNESVAAVMATAPTLATLRYASLSPKDGSALQVAAGFVDLGSCSEDIWTSYRSESDPPFPSDNEVASITQRLRTTFDQGAAVAIGHEVTVDGSLYHQGAIEVDGDRRIWVSDPLRTTGPLTTTALIADGHPGLPLCAQLNALPLTLSDLRPVSDAGDAKTALDAQIAAQDAQKGYVRSVARYDTAKLTAMFQRHAYDLVVDGLGLTGSKAIKAIADAKPPQQLIDSVRIEFLQRNGRLERIEVRALQRVDLMEVIVLDPSAEFPTITPPTDARDMVLTQGGTSEQ